MSDRRYTFQVTVRGPVAGVVAQALRRVLLTIATSDTDARKCSVVVSEPLRTIGRPG